MSTLGQCPRCGGQLHEAEPDVGILSAGCADCHWFDGCAVGDALDVDDQDDRGPQPEDAAEEVRDPGFSFGEPR